MKLKDIVATLEKQGISLSAEVLLALSVLVPLVLALAALLYKLYKARGPKAKRAPSPLKAPGAAAPPQIGARDLLRAFRRFLRRLPWQYRRSLLKFDHFVVFGLAGSGKSRLIEEQSDYRYQMKQIAGDAPLDPELPAALASGAVIIEVPARFLEDQSHAATRALRALFRRLYREKSPTVVVTLDVRWLANAAQIELYDLARTVRVRINQLAAIRRRPLDVRVALTHTGSLDGMEAVAEYWQKAGMSARLELAPEGSLRPSLLEWEAELNAQLPRALSLLDADEYRRVLAFSRGVKRVLGPLEAFLEALFAPDVLSESPTRGGVYFCTGAPELESPLRGVVDESPGPNPLRTHRWTCAAVGAAMIAYMCLAFGVQHRVWAPAADAAASYQVSKGLLGSERERRQRDAILEFTVRRAGLLYRFPDFFGDARKELAEKLSAKLREDLLIPELREVAQHGLGTGHGALRWRRAVYYLTLIHSYRADRLRVKQHLDLWEEMTGLSRDVIRDYVDNTETPHAEPVVFKLGYSDTDAKDTIAYWKELPASMKKAMADGLLHTNELKNMKKLAQEMERSLSRFEHDDLTLEFLRDIDDAADTGGERTGKAAPRLRETYARQFQAVVADVQAADLHHQIGNMQKLCTLVLSTDIESPPVAHLSDLTDRLTLVHSGAQQAAAGGTIPLQLGGEKLEIDVARWKELVGESRATLLIDRFMAASTQNDSIFFTPDADAELAPVVWNPLGNEVTLFGGVAILEGRYTRNAFERRVAKEVQRLAETLATLHIPKDHEERLLRFVKTKVEEYARAYGSEARAFLDAFRLNVRSPEALRVALSQMAGEQSPFDAFVRALDDNTRLSTPAPAEEKTDDAGADGATAAVAQKVEAMLAPVHEALAEFASWGAAVGGSKDAPELGKYKAVIQQLLQDLTAALAPLEDEEGDAPMLEQELTAVGRVALAASRSGAGSYRSLVVDWADAAGLTLEQRAPFLAPFDALSRLGDREVTHSVARAWSRELSADIAAIARKFPFNRRAETSASPEEIEVLFHPRQGRFAAWVRSYVEPLFPRTEGKPDPSATRKLKGLLPEQFHRAAETARLLGERLWDESGAPRLLEVRVTRVPFEHAAGSARSVPTMIYLHAGKTSVFNFNQAPGSTTLAIDWTRDEAAELGVQVTDVETEANSFPPPIAVVGPYWRLLRLLENGKATRLRGESATRYEWDLPFGSGARETVRAALIVHGDPWSGFSSLDGEGGQP